jgi:hypothetical protein
LPGYDWICPGIIRSTSATVIPIRASNLQSTRSLEELCKAHSKNHIITNATHLLSFIVHY